MLILSNFDSLDIPAEYLDIIRTEYIWDVYPIGKYPFFSAYVRR